MTARAGSAPRVGRYLYVGRIAARQQWAYRSELLMRAISMVIFMSIFVALWTTVYSTSGGDTLAGFSLLEMVWYLAMTETVTLSSSRIFVEISQAVKSGDIAYKLTYPLSYPFFQVANSLGGSAPRFVLNLATAALVVALGAGGVAGSWAGAAAFLVMAWLALALDALIAVLIGLLAFWMEEVNPVYWIYQKLLFTVGGLFLPLEWFPEWLRRLATWLPFGYVTYAPARAFVAFAPGPVGRMLLGQLIYTGLFSLTVVLVWALARRRLVVQGG